MKSPESAGGELQHFRASHVFELVGRAYDCVGDKVRQMAGHREHEVVVLGVHHLDIGAERESRTRAASRPPPHRHSGGGVRIVHLLMKSSAKPASGPGMLGAGDGMRRDEMHIRWQKRLHVAQHGALDRADIGNDGAGPQMRRDLLRHARRRRRPERRR